MPIIQASPDWVCITHVRQAVFPLMVTLKSLMNYLDVAIASFTQAFLKPLSSQDNLYASLGCYAKPTISYKVLSATIADTESCLYSFLYHLRTTLPSPRKADIHVPVNPS